MTAAAAAGIGVAGAAMGIVGLQAFVLVAGAGALLACVSLFGKYPAMGSHGWTLAALALAGSAGGIRYVTYHALPSETAIVDVLSSGAERTWHGRIVDDPVYRGGSVRFILELEASTPPVRVLVSSRSPPDAPLSRCDEISAAGRLDRLPRRRNPGDFDYGRHLFHRRVLGRLYVEEALVKVGEKRAGVLCAMEGTRAVVRGRIERYVAGEGSRAVLHALLLGDRRLLDEDVRNRFARMGLLHLLAVSGLHVMIVGMVLYRLLGPFLKRFWLDWLVVERVRTGCTFALLIAYMLLTGCSPSVVRAVVMTTGFLISAVLQRPSVPLNALGTAVLVLLAVRPAHLFEAGFQLSVAAVWGILAVRPQIAAWVPEPENRLGRHVHAATAVTVAATAATLPVSLYHFGQVGLAGLVLNLPGIPVTAAALTSGIALVTVGDTASAVGATLGSSADLLSNILLYVTDVGDRYLSWSVVRWSVRDPVVLAAVACGVASLAVWDRQRARWACVIAACTLPSAQLVVRAAGGAFRPHVDVVFLDVGQGDATLLRLPGGAGVLIDAGPRTIFSDAGARVVVPQLAYHGVRRLSSVVITHPDSDHLGGLPSVLRSVPVGRVIRSGFVSNSNLYADVARLLDSLGVRQHVARTGDTLVFSGEVRGYVLHPPENFAGRAANDHSIVMTVRFGDVSFLLTGDAPAGVELALTRAFGRLLESHVLKVGHHGSRTSSTSAFLHRISRGANRSADNMPYAIVSVAAGNRFGLPDEDVLERLASTGFRVAETPKHGAVWLRTDGKRLKRIHW